MKASILWLSDMHIKCANDVRVSNKLYENGENLVALEIYGAIRSCLTAGNYRVTHILFTGDISFSSDPEQYGEARKLIEMLGQLINNVKIIFVPGNHDLDRKILGSKGKWFKRRQFSKYLDSNRRIQVGKIASDISNGNIGNVDLFRLFDGYVDFVTLQRSSSKELVRLIGGDLYDIVIDMQAEVIFYCFNSAWFAWGVSKLREVKDYSNLSTSDMNMMNVIDLGNLYVIEANYLLETYQRKIQGNKVLNTFLNVAVMHHPMDWLAWSERYDQKSSFNQMMKIMDIVLTSHVHADDTMPSKYRGNALWLESAQLSDHHLYDYWNDQDHKYSIEEINAVNNHGFSVIEIRSVHEFESAASKTIVKVKGFDYTIETTDIGKWRFRLRNVNEKAGIAEVPVNGQQRVVYEWLDKKGLVLSSLLELDSLREAQETLSQLINTLNGMSSMSVDSVFAKLKDSIQIKLPKASVVTSIKQGFESISILNVRNGRYHMILIDYDIFGNYTVHSKRKNGKYVEVLQYLDREFLERKCHFFDEIFSKLDKLVDAKTQKREIRELIRGSRLISEFDKEMHSEGGVYQHSVRQRLKALITDFAITYEVLNFSQYREDFLNSIL